MMRPKKIHGGETGFYLNPPVHEFPCYPIFVQVNDLGDILEMGTYRIVLIKKMNGEFGEWKVRETVSDIDALMRGALRGKEELEAI